MSLLSNSVYSSVFTYNPYVLTRPYQHLTFIASIEPHQITCISHDINILIVGFGDRACTHAEWMPLQAVRRTRRPFINKLSDNKASDNGL